MEINPQINYFDINLNIHPTVELNEKYYEACKKHLEKMDDKKKERKEKPHDLQFCTIPDKHVRVRCYCEENKPWHFIGSEICTREIVPQKDWQADCEPYQWHEKEGVYSRLKSRT